MNEKLARTEICKIGKLLYDKGMIAGTEGNLSCRVDEDSILITQAGICKGNIEPEEIVRLTKDGIVEGNGVPSSEYQLHLAAYIRNSAFNAAVHAHAPHLSAFAIRGESLANAEGIPEFKETFGAVPIVPFAPPGSKELGEKLVAVLGDKHTFLLERHGAIAFGADLRQAFYRLEMAEQIARTLILSRALEGTGKLS